MIFCRKNETSLIVSEYVDLVHEYEDISKFAPIWDLAYVLYFSTKEDNLAIDLNDWINENEPMPECTDDKDLDFIRKSALHHVLRGNFFEAIEALNASLSDLNELQLSAIKSIIDLLEKFELLQQNRDDKASYAYEWTAWHEECEVQLQTFLREVNEEESSQLDEDIRAMLYILFGDEEYIMYEGSYFERIIGCILYSRPTITKSELAHVAQKLIIKSDELNECAYIMMGCFDDAFEFCHDLWLQTHLGHALIVVGAKPTDEVVVESVEKEYIIDPVYYCIDEYATMLAEKHNLWKEAIIYITACVENREIWIIKVRLFFYRV